MSPFLECEGGKRRRWASWIHDFRLFSRNWTFLVSFDDSRNHGFLKTMKAKKDIACWSGDICCLLSRAPYAQLLHRHQEQPQAWDGRAGPMGFGQQPQAKLAMVVVTCLPSAGSHLPSWQLKKKVLKEYRLTLPLVSGFKNTWRGLKGSGSGCGRVML